MTNQEFFINCWRKEMPLTVTSIRTVPQEKWDWQPHAKTRSAKQLIDHITSHAEDLVEVVETGVMNHRVLANYPSTEEAVNEFEKFSERLLQAVAQTSEKDWEEKIVTMFIFGNKIADMRLCDMCWLLLFDTVHHRGQLSVYFRPMGAVNPYIYGPTAEMTEAMMTSQN
jgi:uncharacterized damage-inducible protein DinB